MAEKEAERILSRGEREGRRFLEVCDRKNMTVLEVAFAAQVMLTYCREAMKPHAQEWNEFSNELSAAIKIPPPPAPVANA